MNPRPSQHTLSNAMDVGDPSNFARMMDLYKRNLGEIRKDIVGYSFTDTQTGEAMRIVSSECNYTLDPHGAIGYLGLKKYMAENGADLNGIFLATAHPAKFKEVVERAIGHSVPLPPALQRFIEGTKDTVRSGNRYDRFKETLVRLLG